MDRSSYEERDEPQNERVGCEGWVPSLIPRDGHTAWLARTIEAEIIPRLMLAHRGDRLAFPPYPQAELRPSPDDVVELARLSLGQDAEAPPAFVRLLRARGMRLETVFLELLAPAARHLGVMWETDQCSFSEVTIGLWRLQQVMHELSPEFERDAAPARSQRRAILVPVPGSQHTLGLFMVAEFFRREGWDVWGDATLSAAEIVHAAHAQWFDLLGLSIGSETHERALASVILDARKKSRNPSLVVIVGGPIVTADPAMVARVGADATAHDAPDAVQRAERLVAARSLRS